MTEEERARAALLRANEESRRQIAIIKECRPLRFEILEECLAEFVLAKFMLTREETEGVDFQQLSKLSLAKSMKISKELVKEYDMARGCAGTTSELAKKTLLFMAIQKQLQLELPAERLPHLHSFADLAQLVWKAMTENELWKDKLAST